MDLGTSNIRFDSLWFVNEQKRLSQQNQFMQINSLQDRKSKGQFFTPYPIAEELVEYALNFYDYESKIEFLEPAFGTGVFYSALQNKCNKSVEFISYEVDSDLISNANGIWNDKFCKLSLFNQDFVTADVVKKVDLLITNPPYLRHQLINHDLKLNYLNLLKKQAGIQLSGLSDLYCHFILSAHKWLKNGAIACWILPSEFMDVNYGRQLKNYLLNTVKLIKIHRYDPLEVQFSDALVTSTIVWYTNLKTEDDYYVEFTYGGTHSKPNVNKKIKKSELIKEDKWTRFPNKDIRKSIKTHTIGDFFTVNRGLATGDNSFFIIDKETIEKLNLKYDYLQPILPSPRYLNVNQIFSNANGEPLNLKYNLFLINCKLNEESIIDQYPELWEYLKTGVEITSNRYLCKKRKKWYFQEQRLPAPLLCTYMGRGSNAIKFIKNDSNAVATNSFLMLYPKENMKLALLNDQTLLDKVWFSLNNITSNSIDDEGRIYGGGLKKIEPKELLKVQCDDLIMLK